MSETAECQWAARRLGISHDLIRTVEWESHDEGYESTGPDVVIGAEAVLVDGTRRVVLEMRPYDLGALVAELLAFGGEHASTNGSTYSP